MTSTSVNIGMASGNRNSSRVLKPPGGGYSNIFGDATPQEVPKRSKNNQQNSAGMSAVMGTIDANEVAAKTNELITATNNVDGSDKNENQVSTTVAPKNNDSQPSRKRVPPGGFSSGLW